MKTKKLPRRVKKVDEGKQWTKSFLPDVQRLQEFKQHHVQPMNSETGERELVTGCRRKDNPDLCKGDFPRTQRLIDRAVVLCPGLLRRLAMPFQGRRNKIEAMHGPMNHAYLNGTHPALLVAMRFNSDVQLPYRMPISAQTHANDCCDNPNCLDDIDVDAIIDSCQNAQNAQAGYACDYTVKIKLWRSMK